ncbi:nucleotide-binding domain-containing protein [Athelia psychrophila]|uniref:Nucleotide-binding domain-containing protein n=1 Tax=Athelia psychrophila TaxID=1759441 RepID=A0A166P8A6_9AGAM|nr:nucleotide-binding domain-containing protein [Fibularhizoctonia sp. CBS 109695]
MAPFKLAVIGAGPSAFYVASRLLSCVQQPMQIHMYDRLWAPHGLVRYGVAPDHPEIKMCLALRNCIHKFDEAAADPRFRFFGNVNVGTLPTSPIPHNLHLPVQSLLSSYTHLLYATGCTLPTLHPALPPAPHCMPALDLVHWYTQHPFNPAAPPPDKLSHVTLIGNGNVSLDIARMVLAAPADLAKYDIPEALLAVLARSTVRHVSIVTRRGPLEAAFTVKELRELINLPGASMVPIDPVLLAPPAEVTLSRQQTRMLALLRQGSVQAPGSTPKSWSLDFFRSPTGLAPVPPSSPPTSASTSTSTPTSTPTPNHLTLALAHTALDPTTHRAGSTGETSLLPTSLVIPSLGFHADPTSAFSDPALGYLRTLAGRIVRPAGTTLRNTYASGWAAMGARGVIASTMMDAYSVADTILGDVAGGAGGAASATTPTITGTTALEDEGAEAWQLSQAPPDGPPSEITEGLARGAVMTYADWKAVDTEEVARGARLGKERERMGWEAAIKFLAGRRG